MARNSGQTSQKRARERARAVRQQEKRQRRAEAQERKAATPRPVGGEDPDLAGMQPGPQPRPNWLDDEPDDASGNSNS